MSEYKMYMVLIEPLALYRVSHVTCMKVVIAKSAAEALRIHGMGEKPHAYYKKPSAKLFETLKEYRI